MVKKIILSLLLILPPIYGYWRGDTRWMIYDLSDPQIFGTFVTDTLLAYLVGGIFAFILLRIWGKKHG